MDRDEYWQRVLSKHKELIKGHLPKTERLNMQTGKWEEVEATDEGMLAYLKERLAEKEKIDGSE